MPKQTRVITKRRKFIEVEIPIVKYNTELIATSPEELKDKTIRLDLTRQLKGKSLEAVVKIKIENKKAVAYPIKLKLMPYFIRRMIRKRISYIEDSFETPSQESMIIIKPFLITRKRVSRAVRRTIRNKAKNWIEDYITEKKDDEIFKDILSNRMQKPLSLMLKKTYPLSLCEIRILEIKRALKPDEIPKIKPKLKTAKTEEVLDQLEEIEQEKIKKAQEEIKKAQEKAAKIEKETDELNEKEPEKPKEEKNKKIKSKTTKKETKKTLKTKKTEISENGN